MKLCQRSPHHGAYETVCQWCEPETAASADADEADQEVWLRLPTWPSGDACSSCSDWIRRARDGVSVARAGA